MPVSHCINCGAELAAEHRHCPGCGTERWTPPQENSSSRPPPGAGSQPFGPAPPRPAAPPRLRWLPLLFAAGAVFWLIQLVQFAAIVAAPTGRDELRQALTNAGITKDVSTVLAVESVLVFLLEGTAAALHAAAYYGLRKFRAWGWIAAVIVAAAWSLVLVGVPMLILLLRRTTRQAYGVS